MDPDSDDPMGYTDSNDTMSGLRWLDNYWKLYMDDVISVEAKAEMNEEFIYTPDYVESLGAGFGLEIAKVWEHAANELDNNDD